MARAKSRSTGKRSTSRVVVVAKTKRKKRVSGTAVGKTKARKKRRSVGATKMLSTNNLQQIGSYAIGIAIGAMGQHFVLRPIEQMIIKQMPQAEKFLPALEIMAGGLIAIKGKNSMVKAAGLGVLAGGVYGLMRKANIPGISGPGDDYSTIRIPIAGDLENMVSGLLSDNRRQVRTNVIAGMDTTEIIAGSTYMPATNIIAGDDVNGIWDDVYQFPRAKGI